MTTEAQQQEWTGLRLINRINEIGESNVADEINAALAAERELAEIGLSWKQDSSLETWFPFTANELAELKQQLAAERQKALRLESYAVELDKAERAERQRREQEEQQLTEWKQEAEQQLLSAQVAIEKLHDALVAASSEFNLAGTEATARKINKALEVYPDLSLLHRHVAEVRKPLMDLLSECRTKLDWSVTDGEFLHRIDDALAKVKQ